MQSCRWFNIVGLVALAGTIGVAPALAESKGDQSPAGGPVTFNVDKAGQDVSQVRFLRMQQSEITDSALARAGLRGVAACVDGALAPNSNCQVIGGSGALASNAGFICADNFRPFVSGTIRSMCFSGVITGTAHGADTLTISFFNFNPVTPTIPGTLITTFTSAQITPNLTRVLAGQQRFGAGNREYDYTFNLPTPIAVTAGTCYWVSVRNIASGGTFFWNTASFADGLFAQDGEPAGPGGVPPAQPPNGWDPLDADTGSDLCFCLNINPFSTNPPSGGIPGGLELNPASCGSGIPAPANDQCSAVEAAAPVAVASGQTVVVPGTTTGATPETPAAPFCGISSAGAIGVWYKVVGNGNFMTASTCTGTFNSYDGVIQVYDGTGGCSLLSCINGNDDTIGCATNGGAAEVTWCAQSGVTYFIFVRHFFGSGGQFDLAIADSGVAGACGTQCSVTPAAINENEPFCGLLAFGGTQVNDGCSVAGGTNFTNINCGDAVAGTIGTTGTTRDLDWYRFVAPPGADNFIVTVSSETDAILFCSFAPDDAGGPTGGGAACDTDVQQFFIPIEPSCTPTGVNLTGIAGGQVFYFFVATPDFDSPICVDPPGVGNNYNISITCPPSFTDCNNDGIDDATQIGPTTDCFDPAAAPIGGVNVRGGANGTLDECECVANWDRNASVNSGDVTAYLASWFADLGGTVPAGSANINCDASTNSGDVTAFLALWFAGLAGGNGCP